MTSNRPEMIHIWLIVCIYVPIFLIVVVVAVVVVVVVTLNFKCIRGHLKLNVSILDLQIFDSSKSVRNRPENTPKPSQNLPQTIPNPSKNRSFDSYYDIWKKSEKIEPKKRKIRKIWDRFGMVWGYFRDDFGTTLKNQKIESSELKS